jgi:hypothetical protein
MMRILKFLSGVIILMTIFSLAINLTSIYYEYSEIKKACGVAISHAQKNGGFTDESVLLFNRMIAENGLRGKISTVNYVPGINIPVQKREQFEIVVRPKISIRIPFVGEQNYSVSDIRVIGFSQKYFK